MDQARHRQAGLAQANLMAEYASKKRSKYVVEFPKRPLLSRAFVRI